MEACFQRPWGPRQRIVERDGNIADAGDIATGVACRGRKRPREDRPQRGTRLRGKQDDHPALAARKVGRQQDQQHEQQKQRQRARKLLGFAGTRRAIVSHFLKGKRWTQEARSAVFKEAAEFADRIVDEGRDELERFIRMGEVGKVARRAGGFAFGRHGTPKDKPTTAIVRRPQLRDVVSAVQRLTQEHRDDLTRRRRAEEELSTAITAWRRDRDPQVATVVQSAWHLTL